jgi:putative DNA primase/helicase
MSKSLVEHALKYEKQGWFVLPVNPVKKQPLIKWAHRKNKRPAAEEIQGWYKKWPNARIGVATGSCSGVDAVDLDGPQACERFHALYGTPETIAQTTGRDGGGVHLFFKHNGHGLINVSGKNENKGIDLRTDGGFVVVAPSSHKSGKHYQWSNINPAEDGLDDLLEMPADVIKHFKRHTGVNPRREPITLEPVENGARNDTLTRIVGKWISQGLDRETVLLAANGWNSNLDEPLSDKEVLTTVESVFRTHERNHPDEKLSASLEILKTYHCTDLGNAERFADHHREGVRYCHPQKKWLSWTGKRWQPDAEGLVNQLAKQTTRFIYSEAARAKDGETRKALGKWAAASESAYRQKAMVELAKSEQGVPVLTEELDRDKWLLNVNNGTLNLKTGRLQRHRKDDLITKLIPINYDPDALCPKWIDFLSQVMKGKQSLVNYLWRVAGYTLTGDAGEQCLFLLWGVGQNGKSTFLNVQQTILNDYALQTDFNTFIVKKGDGIRNDIARMIKSRLVVAIETSDGKRMDETVVKQLTGGDRVTARHLYQEYFEYRPEFKIFLATNYKPEIHGQDWAIWRRIRLIPFTVTIPEEKRINNYESVLLEEKEGIFNWMVSGCREWLKKGLDEPAEVEAATKAYRSEMDILEDFIAVRCFIVDGERTTHKELYTAYEGWCDENGETPIKTRTFAKKLQGRGFLFTKPKNLKTWHDIGLK